MYEIKLDTKKLQEYYVNSEVKEVYFFAWIMWKQLRFKPLANYFVVCFGHEMAIEFCLCNLKELQCNLKELQWRELWHTVESWGTVIYTATLSAILEVVLEEQ